MNDESVVDQLMEGLSSIPIIDVHTHLVGGRLGARGLHDILLYHMSISDLFAAGCPQGSRLTEFPQWPSREEAHTRIRQSLPYLEQARNTSIQWGIRMILRDLYQWNEPVTETNWQKLDDLIRERAEDRSWHRDILQKVNIQRSGTEWVRRGDGQDNDILQYSLEWAFFTRCQWGEYDTALYELEKCWGKTPESPSPIRAGGRPATAQTIQTLDDVHHAIFSYVNAIPYERIVSLATHISTDLDLRLVTEEEMEAALKRREQAGERERSIYASYINERFLNALEEKTDRVVFQFSLGAEPLPYETGSRLSQQTIAQLGQLIGRHPKLRFQCFLSSLHANQSLCTLCRELPNFSLAGYWWHNFFPSTIRQVMEERLDMLPVNKQMGFFSDAYCAEWSYAKALLVRRQMAEVLARKVIQGQYSLQDALSVARDILWNVPNTYFSNPSESNRI